MHIKFICNKLYANHFFKIIKNKRFTIKNHICQIQENMNNKPDSELQENLDLDPDLGPDPPWILLINFEQTKFVCHFLPDLNLPLVTHKIKDTTIIFR